MFQDCKVCKCVGLWEGDGQLLYEVDGNKLIIRLVEILDNVTFASIFYLDVEVRVMEKLWRQRLLQFNSISL